MGLDCVFLWSVSRNTTLVYRRYHPSAPSVEEVRRSLLEVWPQGEDGSSIMAAATAIATTASTSASAAAASSSSSSSSSTATSSAAPSAATTSSAPSATGGGVAATHASAAAGSMPLVAGSSSPLDRAAAARDGSARVAEGPFAADIGMGRTALYTVMEDVAWFLVGSDDVDEFILSNALANLSTLCRGTAGKRLDSDTVSKNAPQLSMVMDQSVWSGNVGYFEEELNKGLLQMNVKAK